MKGVKDFLKDSIPAMVDYILVVSTPTRENATLPSTFESLHDRLVVIHHLRQRVSSMPVLEREAVPILPHLLDIPRHLAIITSAIVRNSREFQARAGPHGNSEAMLNELCARCFDMEEQALLRVSQLASSTVAKRRHPLAVQPNPSARTLMIPSLPSTPTSPGQRRPRRSLRPSTAPPTSESTPSPVDNTIAALGPRLRAPAPPDHKNNGPRRHLYSQSTSTDALASFVGETPEPPAPPTEPLVDYEDSARTVLGIFKRGILRR